MRKYTDPFYKKKTKFKLIETITIPITTHRLLGMPLSLLLLYLRQEARHLLAGQRTIPSVPKMSIVLGQEALQ